MATVGELLASHPFFTGLDESAVRRLGACSQNVRFRPGELLFREGGDADRLLVLRRGRVALDVHVPGRGIQVVSTVDAGDVVGWSWLVPP